MIESLLEQGNAGEVGVGEVDAALRPAALRRPLTPHEPRAGPDHGMAPAHAVEPVHSSRIIRGRNRGRPKDDLGTLPPIQAEQLAPLGAAVGSAERIVVA